MKERNLELEEDIRRAYLEWSAQEGIDPLPLLEWRRAMKERGVKDFAVPPGLSKKEFDAALEDPRFYGNDEIEGFRVWIGITLKRGAAS